MIEISKPLSTDTSSAANAGPRAARIAKAGSILAIRMAAVSLHRFDRRAGKNLRKPQGT
jgi:hypothetical protein